MATDVFRVIDPDGAGDYTSHALWVAGEQTDAVTQDLTFTTEFRSSAGSPDTSSTVINGFTLSATNDIVFFVAGNSSGFYDTSKPRIEPGNNRAIQLRDGPVHFINYQIKTDPTGSQDKDCINFYTGIDVPTFSFYQCIFEVAGSTNRGSCIIVSNVPGSTKIYVGNCIFNGANGNSADHALRCNDAQATIYAYNNTIRNCYWGLRQSSGTLVAKNNAVECNSFNASFTDFNGAFDAASDYNASSDGTAPGTNSITPTTWGFVSSTDFHITASSDLLGAGVNLSTDPDFPIADDIDGDTRTNFSIGADDGPSTGGITVSVSDTGVGTDAAPSISASLSLSETGTGTEALLITNSLAIADAATGTDALTIRVGVSIADVGIASDVVGPFTAIVNLAENGAGVDTLALLLAQLAVSEIGVGVDSVNADTGAIVKRVSEAGVGADSVAALTVLARIAESAFGAEAVSAAVDLAISEVGTGTDAVSVLVRAFKTITETGSGADTVQVRQLRSVSDTGSGSDLVTAISALARVSDTGSGVDVVSVITGAFVAIAETGSGLESLTITATLSIAEAGGGIDTVTRIITPSGSGGLAVLTPRFTVH